MNANSISELTKIMYLSYFHYLHLFYLIVYCLYQSAFKGKFLWYCGNTDEKLHNIFKVKSTKILSGDSWAPFSIVLNWVLTFYSNKLQDLTNLRDQLKKHSHLPNSWSFHYLEKKLLVTGHNFFKIILRLQVHSNKYITILLVEIRWFSSPV